MNTDLQDIIAQSTIRAFNAGFEHGKRLVLDAVETVAFDYHDLKVAAISDLEEELQIKADAKVVPQVTLSEADLGKEHAAG
jgi:hypothetical protein